jgi:hypothetical protein
MPWPHSQDYNEAIQDPALSFSDPGLRRGRAVTNSLGIPQPCSGNFADVYAVEDPASGVTWAVKCFTREVPGRREHYQRISRHVSNVRLPFLVDFAYLDQGIRVGGAWYPVVKMPWVDGLPLNQCLPKYVDRAEVFEALSQLWRRLAGRLWEAHIIHGDLQHGNILLVPKETPGSWSVKLVDYDGLCVEGLTPLVSAELGHPAYQHPERLRKGVFAPAVDRFSHLVIYTALRALRGGGRGLWERYDTGDNLLFCARDFEAPGASPLIRELLESPDAEVSRLALVLRLAAQQPLDQVPALEAVLAADPRDLAPPRQADGRVRAPAVSTEFFSHAAPPPVRGQAAAHRAASATAESLSCTAPPPIRVHATGGPPPAVKRCPYCTEKNELDALVCSYCLNGLTPSAAEEAEGVTPPPRPRDRGMVLTPGGQLEAEGNGVPLIVRATEQPRRRKRTALLILFGLAVLGVAAAAFLMTRDNGTGSPNAVKATATTGTPDLPWSREAFSKHFLGKGQADVKQQLGEPDKKVDYPGLPNVAERWVYRSRSLSRADGSQVADLETGLVFSRAGQVIDVIFSPSRQGSDRPRSKEDDDRARAKPMPPPRENDHQAPGGRTPLVREEDDPAPAKRKPLPRDEDDAAPGKPRALPREEDDPAPPARKSPPDEQDHPGPTKAHGAREQKQGNAPAAVEVFGLGDIDDFYRAWQREQADTANPGHNVIREKEAPAKLRGNRERMLKEARRRFDGKWGRTGSSVAAVLAGRERGTYDVWIQFNPNKIGATFNPAIKYDPGDVGYSARRPNAPMCVLRCPTRDVKWAATLKRGDPVTVYGKVKIRSGRTLSFTLSDCGPNPPKAAAAAPPRPPAP